MDSCCLHICTSEPPSEGCGSLDNSHLNTPLMRSRVCLGASLGSRASQMQLCAVRLLKAHIHSVQRHFLSLCLRVKGLCVSPVWQNWWVTDSDCDSWPDLLLFGPDDPMQPCSFFSLCWAYTALSIGYPKTSVTKPAIDQTDQPHGANLIS